MTAHRAPVHGPGTYDGAVMGVPRRLSRTDHGDGVTVHEHGVAGAVITTHRTVRTSPAGWVWRVTRGDWTELGYVRTQREALAVAVGRLCRAVDAGAVTEASA